MFDDLEQRIRLQLLIRRSTAVTVRDVLKPEHVWLAEIRAELMELDRLAAADRGVDAARKQYAARTSGATPPATVTQRVTAAEAGNLAVLAALQAAGFSPLHLPAVVPGRACAAKSGARRHCSLSTAAFDKAWLRLTNDRRILREP